MIESKFQAELIRDLTTRFPGCVVLKNDPNYIQGIPDLTVLYKQHWAVLECKKDAKAKHQPNQEYYISKLNEMSYSKTIYPENKEVIMDELQQAFTFGGSARVPECE